MLALSLSGAVNILGKKNTLNGWMDACTWKKYISNRLEAFEMCAYLKILGVR